MAVNVLAGQNAPATKPANAPSWVTGILNGIGAPVTATNIKALEVWHQFEQSGASNNPFNTTLTTGTSTSYNSVGVQNYPDESTGVAATVQTLNQSNMSGIKTALVNGESLASIEAAINASPWGTHISSGAQNGNTALNSTPNASSSAGGTSASDCGNGKGIDLKVTSITACQLKAVKGGLLAVAGGFLMLAGVALVISKTGLGKKVVEGTGIGIAAELVGKRMGTGNSQPTPREPKAPLTRTTARERDFERSRSEGKENARRAGSFPEE